MQIPCFSLLILASAALFFAALPVHAAPPDADNVLKSLRAGHPRLLVLDADIARVKKVTETDPAARAMRDGLRAEGEKILTEPTVEYKIVGPRLLDQSRRCLSRVYTLATLYRLDGDTKWADRAKKELLAAAAFPDWNPSHFLDVAEMTHAFAIGYDWLYPALSDDDRKILRMAIVEKGLRRGEEAYKGEKPWKSWTTARHNWNQVCNGGLLLGALAVAEDEPTLSGFIVYSALKSLPPAMASFGPDGGWNEGPGYWSYTTRYAVPLISGLESALGSDFGLATANGFDRTGTFRLYFVGPTGRAFNYADAGDTIVESAPAMRWLAQRFQQPLYQWEAQRAMKTSSALDLLWYQPVITTPKAAKIPLDNLFRGVEVAFLRSAWEDKNALWVGFKGGDNKANHSHLDLGEFVFDALGERWVTALGGDNYNLPAYFGKERWNYYRNRTEGQNSPLLDDKNQDTKAAAPLLAYASRPETAYAVADLTAGYAPADATKVQRGVALVNNRSGLLVQDEFTTKSPVNYTWQIHTRAEVTASGKEATLTLNGKTLKAYLLSAPPGAVFTVVSAAPPAINGGQGPQQNPNTGVQKLMVRLSEKTSEARIAVLLAPAEAAATAPVMPLADWVKSAPPLPALGGSLANK